MANNYLQFSEVLDNLSTDEIKWFKFYLDEMEYINANAEFRNNLISTFWKNVLDGDKYISFGFEIDEEEICFFSEEFANVDILAQLIKHFFLENRPNGNDIFSITWAEYCDKLRPGEFGGGACVITKDNIYWYNTYDFVKKKIDELSKDFVKT